MKLNQLKAGAVLSYITMGLGYIISIIYTPIMLRILGQSEYGLYNLVASVVAYLGLLNFGFGSAYIRYYSRFKIKNESSNIAKLNGMFLVVFILIGLVAILAGMLLVFNTDTIFGAELTVQEISKARTLMAIMVVNIAFTFPNIVFNSYITANERFVFQKLLQMIKIIANPFIVLPLLLLGYGSVGMVVITTMMNILIEIANAVFCFRKLGMQFSFRGFNLKLMREMTVFSSFIFISLIVDQVNWNIDKFILGRFHGTISVAVYGVAAQLFTYYLSLSLAISSVFVPRVNALVAKNNGNQELTSLFTKVGRVQFILLSLISTGVIFYGKEFLEFWAGASYTGSFPILLLLMLPSTIPLFQNIGIEIQNAKNMHQFRSLLYLLIAIGNLIITIPLAKAYAGVGAALGTAVGQIIGNTVIMNIYYEKKIGLNMRYFWSEILKFAPALIPPVIVGLAMSFYLDLSNMHVFLVSGLIYLVVYSVSMWVLGMNDFEKQLIINPIKSLKIKKF